MKAILPALFLGAIVSGCVKVEPKKYEVKMPKPKSTPISAKAILDSLYKDTKGIQCVLENQDSLETQDVFIVEKIKVNEENNEENLKHTFYQVHEDKNPSIGIKLDDKYIDFVTYEAEEDEVYSLRSYSVQGASDDSGILSAQLAYDKKINEISITVYEQKYDGTQMQEESLGSYKINQCVESEKKVFEL